MGSPRTLLCIITLVLLTMTYVDGLGNIRCPPPSKIYSTQEKCRDDYDCKHGKLCCMGPTGRAVCAEPSGSQYDRYSSGAREEYCGGRKCSMNEECREDPRTRTKICVPKGKRFV